VTRKKKGERREEGNREERRRIKEERNGKREMMRETGDLRGREKTHLELLAIQSPHLREPFVDGRKRRILLVLSVRRNVPQIPDLTVLLLRQERPGEGI
jgi:hypothetical protein